MRTDIITSLSNIGSQILSEAIQYMEETIKNQDNYYLQELQNGSYKAFSAIYNHYADSLYYFILNQLHNKQLAQDILQETFLRLWDNRKKLFTNGNLKSLLFTIASHLTIDYFRKQMTELPFEEYIDYCEQQGTAATPEDLMLYDEFKRQLKKSKQKLSARECEIYELSREKNLSISEIAQQLKLSEQTVNNYLTSSLKSLRKDLSKYNMIFLFFL